MYRKYVKRIIDIIFSSILIILTIPIFILVSILVKINLGSPVIYSQKRPGLNEKIFTLYKFRTMTNEKDKDGNLLPDEERLGDFGKKLRSLSIDELPQIFNVFKGDMSFIGPRPLLIEYLDIYTDEQKHRHDVRPGITGLAQINGRNQLSWSNKFKYDIEYVNNVSFLNDIKILINTIFVIFRRDGISKDGYATTDNFKKNSIHDIAIKDNREQ